LADGQIARRELLSAIQAFRDRREYVPVDPYVERFDASIPLSGPPPTAIYLEHGLPETVLTIWQEAPEVFRNPIDQLRALIGADRKLSTPPSLAMHFREKLRRDLPLMRSTITFEGTLETSQKPRTSATSHMSVVRHTWI